MAVVTAEIRSFRVVPRFGKTGPGGYDFAWDVRPRGTVPKFMVQESPTEGQAADGGWTNLLPAPVTDPFALGLSTRAASWQDSIHYRLVVYAADGTTVLTTSFPTDVRYRLSRHDWLKWREMRRRWALQLNKFSGIPGFLLRRKVTGPKCPRCRDSTLGGTTDPRCRTCYGTDFVGGYYAPVPMMGDWTEGPPDADNTAQAPVGLSEAESESLFIQAFPEAKYKDVWVDKSTGRRFSVVKNDPSNFRTAPVVQKIDVSLLPPTEIVYDFPVPLVDP